MSTIQSYSWEQSRDAARQQRAEAELARRRLELARRKAERAATQHRSNLELARRAESQGRAALDGLGARAARLEGRIDGLAERSRAAAGQLAGLECRLSQSQAELARARSALRAEVVRVATLEQRTERAVAELMVDLARARQGLEAVERVAAAGVEHVDDLARDTSLGAVLGDELGAQDQRIRQLEAEVRFVTQRAELAPVAMATLLAMESNGYHLRDTLTRGELVCYFAQAGAGHQIAVRMAPVERAGEDLARWDLLAETFGLADETCVHELADFETAAEELDLGRLSRGRLRIYPKDDNNPRQRRQGVPRPRANVEHGRRRPPQRRKLRSR